MAIVMWRVFGVSIIKVEQLYITDFADDRKLLWASHNVLVWRVIAKKWTVRFPWDMPWEIFEIEVLENIKWKEKWIISVTKEGWCIYGKCYVFESDTWQEVSASTESLKVWENYILAMRNGETFWHIIISHPAGKYQIADAKELRSNKRLNALKKAYTEEIVFEWDILAKRNINTFSSLPKEEKESIQKSLKE